MSRLKTYKGDLIIVAGLLILPLLLFGSVSIGSQTMLPVDNLFQWQPWSSAASQFNAEVPHNGLLSDLILENYAWKQFAAESVLNGEIPLWNPYNFAGTPFLANGQHSTYYPFSLLFFILPLIKAYGWFTVIQLWLAGVMAYFFGRVMGMRRGSAAVSGLVYQGSGFLIVSSAVFPMILAAAIWLPLLLACVESVIRNTTSKEGLGKTLPWAALGAITLGVQILAGHIEITYYSLLVMAFFAAWRLVTVSLKLWKDKQEPSGVAWFIPIFRSSIWLLAIVGVGLMLGAVQFIPFIEVGQANFREGSATLEEIREWAFPVRRFLTLTLPDFFGNPADHAYIDVFNGETVEFSTNFYGQTNPHGAYTSNWGIKNYVEGGIYLGILPLFLAGLGVWSAWRRRKERRSEIGFFSVLGLLSLSFIFGTPLYAILYYGLPGINQLHSPFRWVFPLSLCVALLAGYGMDYLADTNSPSEKTSDRKIKPRSFLTLWASPSLVTTLAAISFWAGLFLLAGLFISRFAYSRIEQTVERFFLSLERAADAFANPRAFYSFEFEQLFIFALILILTGLALRISRSNFQWRGRLLWPLVMLAIIGLDLFIAGYGFNAASDPALLDHKPELTQWLEQQPGLWRLTTFTPHGDKPLNANTPWLFDLQDIRGYDSIILKQYTDYMAAIEEQTELQFNRVGPIAKWESLNSPLLDLLGVKYIISSEEIDLPKLDIAWQGEGLIVYENLAVSPRAYTIPAAATVIADDTLKAMANFDPRSHVILEEGQEPAFLIANPESRQLSPAEVVTYGNIEVKLQTEVTEPSWLVLNDTYFEGWDAYIHNLAPGENDQNEEQEVDIYRVNGNFRGVVLEPGTWEVRFRYSPLTFKLGGLITFMGAIILLFALAVWIWRRFYRPTGPLTNTGSIAKNSLAPMTLNLFNRAIDFVFAAFYLRILGPADAGRYATAIIIAGWFEIISNWGLNTLIIREVSTDKSQAGRYLLNTSILRIGTALIGSLPVIVYLVIVQFSDNPLDLETTIAIVLLMLGMLFSGLGQGLTGLYYAFEKAEIPAAITTVTTILKVGFGVAVLLFGYGFVGLAAVSIIVNIFTLLILAVSASRQLTITGPWNIDFGLQRRMFVISYPLMLNHLFAVIFFQIDVPLMRQINGEEAVGWYNSAYKWVNAFNVIPAFFTFALFPVISRQIHSSVSDARRTFRMSIKLMVLVALPLAALTTLLAPIMIGILGGREFLPNGAIALQLVIWSIPIGWMNSVTNYVLIALGLERRLTWAFILGVGFNLIANLIFLPLFSFVGASIITIFSEILLLIVFAIFLRAAMPDIGWLKIIKRPLAATALMLWAMVLGSQIHLIVALVFGIAAFLLGLWLLKIFGEDEKQILTSLLPDNLSSRLTFLRPDNEA